MITTYEDLINEYGPGTLLPQRRVKVASLLLQDPQQFATKSITSRLPPRLQAASSADRSSFRFRMVLTTEGPNDNLQFFVDDELALPEVFESPIGEPVNQDHDQSFNAVCGEIYSSEYVRDLVVVGGIHLSGIRCQGVIFSDYYPEVAYKAKTGAGRWAGVSMEAIPNPLEQVGKYLVIHNPKFVGAALVRFAANKHAIIDQVEGEDACRPSTDLQAAILKAGVDYLFR